MENGTVKTFGIVMMYSCAMFTLPFVVYFGTGYVLKEYFDVTGFTNTAWAVVASTLVVNMIIFRFAWGALHDEDPPSKSGGLENEEDDPSSQTRTKKTE